MSFITTYHFQIEQKMLISGIYFVYLAYKNEKITKKVNVMKASVVFKDKH